MSDDDGSGCPPLVARCEGPHTVGTMSHTAGQRPHPNQPAALGAGALAMVAGCLFSHDGAQVLMVRKTHPAWMAGKLNGIGGQIEAGESPVEAMRREFAEEAGLLVPAWEHFLFLDFAAGAVWFFRAFADRSVLAAARTETDESIEAWDVADLTAGATATIANLAWILPLAAHRHDTYAPIWAHELG